MPLAPATDGIEINWQATGAGPDLLLISGTGHDLGFWSRQLPMFEPNFRCIVFDNRGVGKSSVPAHGYSIADMAEDARAVLDAAGASSAHVMGFSMGGHIAQELALRHPARVLSLGLHHTWTKQCPQILAFQRARRAIALSGDMATLAEYSMLGLHAHSYYDAHAEEIEETKRWMIEHSGPPEGWLGQLEACIAGDTSERLGAVRVPTLVTASDQDLLADPHHAREIHERIVGSELVILEGTGHVSLMEDPDRFSKICLEFLERQKAQGSN